MKFQYIVLIQAYNSAAYESVNNGECGPRTGKGWEPLP
jgi:hypothetical protein